MKKGTLLSFAIFFLLGLGLMLPFQAKAQYCTPTGNYCNGLGQACVGNTCGDVCSNCPLGCSGGACIGAITYTVTGNVFVDNGSGGGIAANGIKDGTESGYNGAIVGLTGHGTKTTGVLGNYTFNLIPAGNYNVTLTVPGGYSATTTNPVSIVLGSNTTVNFGIQLTPPPACVPAAIIPGSVTVQPGGTTTLNITSCKDVEDPPDVLPPPPITWNPDVDPGNIRPDPTVNPVTPTPTCSIVGGVNICTSTTDWIAPACPAASATYNPQAVVSGPGGSTTYTTSITVPATYSIATNIRSVSSIGACNSSTPVAYTDSSVSANVTGGSLPIGGTTQNTSTGLSTFTCLPNGTYQVSISVPSGYSVVSNSAGGSTNTITLNNILSDQTVSFCIGPTAAWFQTDKGDVRFKSLSNPVPPSKLGSTDATYPGIFYSSGTLLSLGDGTNASSKNWVISDEYSYNANTQNRKGGMSYDFYKAKTSQDGVTVTPIQGSLNLANQSQIVANGVYEVKSIANGGAGSLSIDSDLTITGKRVVILVDGDVTINNPVKVTSGNGVLIIAAKKDIRIASSVGTVGTDSFNTRLEGIYTAQKSIILEGNKCADLITPDLRLNVGGALVANSLHPFASDVFGGKIVNNRSLCLDNLTYPSLTILSRPDFITQLTDFYKTSYTKWQQVNP